MKKVHIKDIALILEVANLKMYNLIKRFQTYNEKIGSKKHKIYTQESNKIPLSCFDDKRYILDDGIHTLAYGHKDIPKNG